MTNQEILEKAIQKAIDDGWTDTPWVGYGLDTYEVNELGEVWRYDGDGEYAEVSVNDIIFNHDFAKALWGEVVHANFYAGKHGDTIDFKGLNWKGHLINMVIADDPIKYLGENI